jgi:rod shape determining protein RodA
MVAAIFVDPQLYRRFARFIYVAMLGVMLLVLATGAVTRGSRRWIDLGFFRFQPSEFGKVLIALFLAAYLSERSKQIGKLSVPLRAILLAAVPMLLVFVQPDIGTALVYLAVLGAALFASGVRWVHLAAIGLVGLFAVLLVLWWLPASGINVLKPYQAQRLTGVFHPSSDPQGATYNVTQSITTVGAGGLRGRGVAGATQTRLDYIPEHGTDFAFASLAEQRGFLGAAILLLLYLLVVWRGLRVVASAGDLFGAICAAGISFGFLFQVYVNVGMTIGIAPITGIPLPFVSVGGSSMISNLIAMGILQAIYVRGRRRR